MVVFDTKAKPKVEESEKKKRPDLSGDIQTVEDVDGTTRYTKVMSIALWKNEEKKGHQPDYRGVVQPPKDQIGDTYSVSLWDRSVEVSK